jgi:hypothetical protein
LGGAGGGRKQKIRFQIEEHLTPNRFIIAPLGNEARLSPSQWRSARTTNAIERLHEEFKRRIKNPDRATIGRYGGNVVLGAARFRSRWSGRRRQDRQERVGVHRAGREPFWTPIRWSGYDRERSALYDSNLLGDEEKFALERQWRDDFERGCDPDFTICLGPVSI